MRISTLILINAIFSDLVYMFVFCCVDTDQCASGNGGCTHICTDTLPGYECSCNDGFTLSTDGHNCTGEAEKFFNQFTIPLLCTFTIQNFYLGLGDLKVNLKTN